MSDVLMLQEAREAAEVVRRQAKQPLSAVVRAIQAAQPRYVVTVARGSSDHAATTLKYAIETHLRLPVMSAAPSVSGVYGADLDYQGALVLAVSQSGGSPDLVEAVERARRNGALTLAMINQPDSPLHQAADLTLPLCAGEERAVAATKSYLAVLTLGARLLQELNPDPALETALARLPDLLDALAAQEELAEQVAATLVDAQDLLVLGRGLHQGVAAETALKLQETAGLAALAFSTAEFAHGPARLAEPGVQILALQARDATAHLTRDTYRTLRGYGAQLTVVGDDADSPAQLPTPASGHALTDPALSALAIQLLIGHLAVLRGENPDAPPRLSKVTRTV
ncbi:SIS domain-containing protein [Deinococcus sonorensis]|uniref:SIS domain-containing protein n=2 Tax=Deinococcus sonorensis TaxID=309891 RepID=A0AAU7UF08_9DEIO